MAARAQDAQRLAQRGRVVGDVLDDVEQSHHVDAGVGDRQPRRVGTGEPAAGGAVQVGAAAEGALEVDRQHLCARVEPRGEAALATADLQHPLHAAFRAHRVDGPHLLAVERAERARVRERVGRQEGCERSLDHRPLAGCWAWRQGQRGEAQERRRSSQSLEVAV